MIMSVANTVNTFCSNLTFCPGIFGTFHVLYSFTATDKTVLPGTQSTVKLIFHFSVLRNCREK
jgi:hypothetical protein